ncbi:proton-conducting transporter membrane subunit [Aquipuribacter nitratireducens]|uniref:Proton-conducting transporter membrane subunit n=1 Tax=Aquipuribacter nitratireducens TaxID=650104 RepID=A0ABW0GWZ4_9MICO
MNALVAVPVVLPLLAAAVSLLLSPFPVAQRVLGIAVVTGVLACAVVLLVHVDATGPLAVAAGGWAPPSGIGLVVDRLAALVLVLASAVVLVVLVYAVGEGSAEHRESNVPSVFHPTYLVLLAGICLVLVTGDLFTLFVGFETMLMASYVLMTLGATAHRVRSGTTYVVTSLTASLLLLTTVGLVYGTTGTVSLAQLPGAMAEVDGGVRAVLGLLLLLALGTKAALVPLHWWLPDSYPTAPAPVTAVFAALLTKVAVYAVVRTQTLLFPRDEPWPLLLVLAALTMLVGVLGALVQDDVDRALAFVLVSHIGFMLLGLALSSAAGLRATVVYLAHHIVVLVAFFLVAGLAERERGTTSLRGLGGLASSAPLVAGLMLVPALSLGGVPPLDGFVAKLAVLQATVATDGVGPAVLAVVAVLTSLLTLAATSRVWVGACWGEAPERPRTPPEARRGVAVATMRTAAATAVAGTLAVAVLAGPLSALAQRAADDLREPLAYRQALLGSGTRP